MNNGFDIGNLQRLTEDPEFMSKAMNIASMLSKTDMFKNLGSMQNSDDLSGTLSRMQTESSTQQAGGLPGFAAPENNVRASSGRPSGTHEQRIQLLEAMRPFVPEDRRNKIDFIIKLLGLMQVANELGLKNIL